LASAGHDADERGKDGELRERAHHDSLYPPTLFPFRSDAMPS
jgi:hypothetical protein